MTFNYSRFRSFLCDPIKGFCARLSLKKAANSLQEIELQPLQGFSSMPKSKSCGNMNLTILPTFGSVSKKTIIFVRV